MRITREPHDNDRTTAVTPASAALETAFGAALRSYQGRERATRSEATSANQRTKDGTRPGDRRGTAASETLDACVEAAPCKDLLPIAAEFELRAQDRLAALGNDIRPAPQPTIVLRPARRALHELSAEGERCFEVTDARTGAQFLLSCEDGRWLLTLQSGTMSATTDELVSALRQLFATRGLGPVDVIG